VEWRIGHAMSFRGGRLREVRVVAQVLVVCRPDSFIETLCRCQCMVSRQWRDVC
jgi:hypothetical protein